MVSLRLVISFFLLIPALLIKAQSGNVGINTTTPAAPIHVIRNYTSGGPLSSATMAIFESNDEAFLQLSSNNRANGILSGSELSAVRSAIRFEVDSSMQFQAGGSQTKMTLSNDGFLGLNAINPQAMLHVEGGNALMTGDYPLFNNNDEPPVSGEGTRMMWYAKRGAFRTGQVTGSQWNMQNTGYFSFATGENTMAKGFCSFASGSGSSAVGDFSTALGLGSVARGDMTFALGTGCVSRAYQSLALGVYNDTTAIAPYGWNQADPLVVIGNGTYNARKNAFTVLKNGKTGINTHTPVSIFHVVKNSPSGGPLVPTALATFESNDNAYIYLSQPTANQSGLLSGNGVTTIRSGFVFGADSSMHFRSGGNFTKMFLDKQGNFGINTTTPKALLHLRAIGSSGGPLHVYAQAILENTSASYMQFSHKNYAETGFLSGNEETSIRSAIIFRADSSMHLRTGGNFNRMTITKDGAIGINEDYPTGMLHVRKGNTPTGPLHTDAILTLQSNTPSYIHLSNPTGIRTGLVAGNSSTPIRGALYFNGDNTFEIRAGGDTPRLTINPNGNTGIGTTTPEAKLDVEGTFKMGAESDVYSLMKTITMGVDLPSIAANSSYIETFLNAEFQPEGTATVTLSSFLPDGLVIAGVVKTNGYVYVKFTNVTNNAIDPGSRWFYITVIQ